MRWDWMCLFRAFTLLIEEGKEPARAAGEKTGEDRDFRSINQS